MGFIHQHQHSALDTNSAVERMNAWRTRIGAEDGDLHRSHLKGKPSGAGGGSPLQFKQKITHGTSTAPSEAAVFVEQLPSIDLKDPWCLCTGGTHFDPCVVVVVGGGWLGWLVGWLVLRIVGVQQENALSF